MPTEVLTQLRALRESIADGLRKDPRYLTLTALDKTIAEITTLLSASGLDAGEDAPAPLSFDAPKVSIAAPAVGRQPGAASEGAGPSRESRDALAAATMPLVAAALNTTAAQMVASRDDAPVGRPATAPERGSTSDQSGRDEFRQDALPRDDLLRDELPEDDARRGDLDHEGPHHEGTRHEILDHEARGADAPVAAAEPASLVGTDDATDLGALEPAPHEAAFGTAAPHEAFSWDSPRLDAMLEGAPAHDVLAAGAAEPASGHPAVEALPAAEPIPPRDPDTGYIPMEVRPAAAQYQPAMSVKFGKLPNKVDLRPLMPPITDQGALHSAVPEAIAGAYQYWVRKASKQDRPLSRMFIYYNARWRNGAPQTDEGASIQLALEGVQKFGAAHAELWPDDPRLLTVTPTADAYKDAAAFRIHDLAQVPLRLESWKQALAEGKPIIFGCAVFDAFAHCGAHGGIVPYPSAAEVAQGGHLHALCAVGYSESEKVFIVRNAWGTGFGDAGYCYMPFGYVMSGRLNDGDSWVFVPKVPSQPPREMWSDDATPVTNAGRGVDFNVDAEPPENYERLPVDLFAARRRLFNGALTSDYTRYLSLSAKGLWDEMDQVDVPAALSEPAPGLDETTNTLAEFDRLGASLRSMGIEAPSHGFALNPAEPAEDETLLGEDDEARWRP